MPGVVLAVIATLAAAVVAASWGKRHVRRLQRARRIRVDRFKLKRRHAEIELEVFGSREVVRAVQDYARAHHVSIEQATRQARTYLREIVPKFNLLAYYRVGAPLSRAIMRFLYRVVVELKPVRDLTGQHKGASVVYVINHRSNTDYVLVAHMLFKFMSLSYAIGEWARVWPLNHLFKWFGGYFVRRRYREPLYHAVLATFVRTITRHGVTQGVFIEGALSLDGAFQKPKLGMLDYIVTAKSDPEFTAPLFLVPTAVNYDRVLEDRTLTEELLGIEDRSTRGQKFRSTLDYLFRNLLRGVLKRFKRYGYAIVTFGEPIAVDEFVRANPAVLSPSFQERKPELQKLADLVMSGISAAVPVTPVTLLASIFARHDALTEKELLGELAALRERWQQRPWLLREKTPAEIWTAARRVLELRHLIVPAQKWRDVLFEGGGVPQLEDAWQWDPHETRLRDYYANALLPYDEVKRRGWPAGDRSRPPGEAGAAAAPADAAGSPARGPV